MTPKHLRLIYLTEFFVAILAIFTAWSEIGGQAALDLMPWGWKFGLAVGLSVASVGYSAALISEESIWNRRSAKWLSLILVLTVGMGLVTYYYVLQEDNTGDGSDEQDGSSTALHSRLKHLRLANGHNETIAQHGKSIGIKTGG